MLLAKTWLFAQMQHYEQADFNGKKERLTEMVAEIKWWQSYNDDFLLAAGVKPHSISESLQELKVIFARWEAESSPEDRVRIVAFRPRILAALVSDGVSEVIGGDVGKTIGSVLSIFSRPKQSDADRIPPPGTQ